MEDDDEYVSFDGTNWAALLNDAAATTIDVKTAAYGLSAGDFDGKKVVNMNVSSGVALTVTAGLTVTEPVHVYQGGSAAATITADTGVTLLQKNGLVTNGQFAFCSIIPISTNTYLVAGDLTT